jgi:protein-glutamine gamma-glutamyltransferase
MTPPPFLLSCTLLFWGWQSHLLQFAVPMAFTLEIARFINWRLALSDKDFNRVTDLTSLSLIIVALYLVNQESVYGLITLLNWLPMQFFLLIVAQTYSTQGTVNLSSLFLSLRHQQAKSGLLYSTANWRINLSYPYIITCLLAASVYRTSWFFVGLFFIVAWGLWTVRPQRYPVAVWGILLMVAGTLAYLIQGGLHSLQAEIEKILLSHFQDMLFADRDPYRQHTAIGDIGQLKLSDKILLRVDTPYPILLRQASYNIYSDTTWRTKRYHFTNVFSETNATTWSLTSEKLKGEINLYSSLKVSAYLRHGKGILALPHGTYQISELAVPTVQRNDFGAVKVEEGPGLINYTAHFAPKNTPLDVPPTADDLQIPSNDKKYLSELYTELNLSRQNPQQVLNSLRNFFAQHFQYSLKLRTPTSGYKTPLEYFLRESRVGHCEYFATATVLLLRTAGIPARYAAGYAAIEYSELENVYIARQRHAHAWTLAYIDGHWIEFDTTPATWVELEEEMAAFLQPIYDLWSWLVYQYQKWRWREGESSNEWLLWLILPLSVLLIWRLYSREKVARSPKKSAKGTPKIAGSDSAFYQIVEHLNATGYIRQPGETLNTWLKRIGVSHQSAIEMQIMMNLHQRYRFDPNSLNLQEQAQLTTKVEAWLKKKFQS